MTITAELVKELRERTGSGMMECKKALVEAEGDIELALDNLRKKGSAQADKKASNIAAEGIISITTSSDHKKAAMVEVNCQTDFVARHESIIEFASEIAACALKNNIDQVAELEGLPFNPDPQQTIESQRRALVAKLGENIQIRRITLMTSSGSIGTYLHGNRIGVLVAISTDNPQLSRDLAMHIAASRPRAIVANDIPTQLIEKEREIYSAQAQAQVSHMSAEVVEEMIEGRIKKFIREQALLGQSFVKDPSRTVQELLASEKAEVSAFVRQEVGEGIEKKVENFADEVMAQVHGSK